MSRTCTFVPPVLRDPRFQKLKSALTASVAQMLQNIPPRQQNRQAVRQWLSEALERLPGNVPAEIREQLLDSALADLIGYGPLEWLLREPDISEIMVNGPRAVFIERGGELYETDVAFEDDAHVMRIIDRIVNPLGRQVNADHPTADARLPDGSRVHIVIPPVAIDGPHITIRKFLKTKMEMSELIELGALTPYMATFLEACVVARLNILVSGNTSSGKTTILNVLSSYIPEHERIITIEDAVELQLKQKHVVRLETRLPNVDGLGAVSVRDLVRNALRMRPDRIVVGEVRGAEAMDMLQAMNTGHTGSLTTLHANGPRDATSRLETMAMMAGLEMPLVAIRKQIASAMDLIVHLTRLQDGSRKITHITEVVGMEGDVITLMDIFKFEQTGLAPDGKVIGQTRPTGIRPQFNPRLEAAGFKLGGEIFGAGF